MGEKLDIAMFALLQAQLKVGFVFQDSIYSKIVLKNEIAHLTCPVPIRLKFKIFLNLYSKKPRVSLKILMLFSMSSFYEISLTLSRRVRRGLPFFELIKWSIPHHLSSTYSVANAFSKHSFLFRKDVCNNCMIIILPQCGATEHVTTGIFVHP